ncbi:MAG: hypothetical protein V4719_31040 [Planctomycetota bacterium]
MPRLQCTLQSAKRPDLLPRVFNVTRWRLFGLAGILFCVAVFSGCQRRGEAAAVIGTVQFDGKPIAKGVIRLSTEDDTPGEGGLSPITNGKYEVPSTAGLKAGKYLVIVYGFKETGKMIKPDEVQPLRKEEVQFIPKQYNDSSTLHLDVLPGENVKDFDLAK